MAAPVLSNQQRLAGAMQSLAVRRLRADIKLWLSESQLRQRRDRLAEALQFPATQGMRVRTLLRALPGIGVQRSANMLEQARIPLNASVRSLGYRQTANLLDQLRTKS